MGEGRTGETLFSWGSPWAWSGGKSLRIRNWCFLLLGYVCGTCKCSYMREENTHPCTPVEVRGGGRVFSLMVFHLIC